MTGIDRQGFDDDGDLPDALDRWFGVEPAFGVGPDRPERATPG